MELSRELLFFFSALGAFNGLILGLYFLIRAKPRYTSNYFLGILLLALSIRIGKSVFLYFNQDLAGIYLQIGMSACLLIGPSLFYYLRSVIKFERSQSSWKYHFIPLLAIIIPIDVLYPWYDYPHLWSYLFDGIYFIWFVYLVISGALIRKSLSKLLTRQTKANNMEIWINSLYLGNVLIWVVYNTVDYTSYILGALSFSFILYLLILLLIFTRKKDPSFLSQQIKYGNRKIGGEEAEHIQKELDQLIKNQAVKGKQ